MQFIQGKGGGWSLVNGRIYHHLRVKAAHQMSNKRKNKNEKETFENLKYFRNLKGGAARPLTRTILPPQSGF